MLHSIRDSNLTNAVNIVQKAKSEPKKVFLRKLLVVAGVPIDNLTMAETLDRIEQFISIGRESGKTHQIATVNADFVVKSAGDPELGYLLQGADLATPDGMPLVWGARMLGVQVEERVAGSDLVPLLAKRAAEKGYSMYFFGAAPGIAEQARDILVNRHPNLNIVGAVSPPYSSVIEIDQKYIDDIKAANPDILCVALGNPKQEKFIGMYGRELGVPVAIGIGGTLDFIAGKTKRAPLWMQRMGIEWFHRMTNDPKRLVKRYVHDIFGFTSFFAGQWWRLKVGNQQKPILPIAETMVVDGKGLMFLKGRLDLHNNEILIGQIDSLISETYDIDIDLSEVSFIDSVTIGLLIEYVKRCRENDGNLRLINSPARIYTTFKYLKLDRFLDIYNVDESHNELPPYQTSVSEQAISIRLPKRLDATTKMETLKTCKRVAEKNPNIILDFSNTKLIASAGLALLVHLNEFLQNIDGSLTLANCSKEIRQTLEIVKFDLLFSIIELNEEELNYTMGAVVELSGE